MSYRCGLCRAVVPPRTPMRRHVTYRIVGRPGVFGGRLVAAQAKAREEIAAETPICADCDHAVKHGESVASRAAIGAARKRARQASLTARLMVQPVHVNGVHKPKGQPPAPPAVDQRFFGDDEPTPPDAPKCDVCGRDATHGQVTSDTILCPEHCEKAKGN